ncbi:hypothetical protein TAMA11512_05400 [Selenomonas sp. TAMA-11512]|uniref:hypothetical protein n=1 Tax=Selenomonas sp. TAMA-11512 TaxID=3095337 RepID=UPI0030909AB7|nr:hypothetical protein TAMA11512_05400 [Selenomonas sp. TAMA-11512]
MWMTRCRLPCIIEESRIKGGHLLTRLLFLAGFAFILLGSFGWGYTYTVDHRSADSFTAYATIDFQSSYDQYGKIEGATLSIWDYRFDSAKPKNTLSLIIDGTSYDIDALTKQTPPSYDIKNYDSKTSLKNTNKFFIHITPQLIPELRKASEVRIAIRYEGGFTVDLPLNSRDLAYWKAQLY